MGCTPLRSLTAILVAFVAVLFAGPASAQVVINEILYHPSNDAVGGGEDAEDLQFIEVYNAGAQVVDLAGATFADGVTFTFPAGASLGAGEYLLVAQDPAFLALRGPPIPPGVPVFQWANGILANGGEGLRLVDAQGDLIDEVIYDDAGLWPTGADGLGPSLELTNPSYDNAQPLAWRDSAGVNGTPGAENSAFTNAPIVLVEAPARGTIIADIPEISVTFSAPVSGVLAGDLVVDGSAAAVVLCDTCVAGVGAGPYVFSGYDPPLGNPTTAVLGAGAIQDESGTPFAGDDWIYPLSVPAVVINEVHYNPSSATDNEEFIELFNAEAEAVDVSGWTVAEFGSPGCVVPPGSILEPGGFLVCARDAPSLELTTGFVGAFSWGLGDRLSNSGEPIAVINTDGTVIDRIEYEDGPPWPTGPGSPDGNGPTLSLINPGLDNSQGRAWAASLAANGTPGAQNDVFQGAPAVAEESPVRGSLVAELNQITVTFSEPVGGVTPDLLTVGEPGGIGIPASAVVGEGAGPYVFTVDPGDASIVEVILAPGLIEGVGGTPFAGDQWLYFTGLPQLVINEIHYHPDEAAVPPGEDEERLQFLEIYNAEADPVDMSGFAMTSGVGHIFADGTVIPAGGYMVLAQDADFLQATLPIPPEAVVVEWTSGGLSNTGEKVQLKDAFGHELDDVVYDDAGDWTDEPDGRGPSLELVNPNLANKRSGAWQASAAPNGTPGAQNSTHQANPPPVIFAPRHDPPIPGANQQIRIFANVIDDGEAAPTVTLNYREDRNPPIAYQQLQMVDDGQNGDETAGDGVFHAVVPGLPNNSQLDFYITASDGEGGSEAPAGHSTPNKYGQPSQTFLAKVSDEVLPQDAPTYHILVTLHNKAAQEALRGFPARKERFDATFIDDRGNIWYNVSQRYRGQSSLSRIPSSYRVDFPRNRKLDSVLGFPVETLQLMADRPLSQVMLYTLFGRAGLPSPKAAFAHLRYPGINYDNCCDGRFSYWGLHAVVERMDNAYLDSQGGALDLRPTSSEGNLYRGRNNGDLRWEGVNKDTYRADVNGRNGYEKYNNEDEDFWQDLISLTDALNNTPDSDYVEHVKAHVDLDNWAGYFAMHTLLGNREGGLYRDTGDDYFIYFPPQNDPLEPAHPDYSTPQLPGDTTNGRAKLLVWDGDSAMLGGDETIWRTRVAAPARWLRHNGFAPIYIKAIEDFAASIYSVENVHALLDEMPDGAFGVGGNINGPQTRQHYKDWITRRHAFVHNETVDALTLVGGPHLVHEGAAPTFPLGGRLQQAGTHNITVNGVQVTYSVFTANWSYELPLAPGPNPALIQSWDREGNVKETIDASVFWNPIGQPDEIHLDFRAPDRMLNTNILTVDVAILDPIGRTRYQVWDELGTITAVRLPDRTPVAITNTVFDPHVPVIDNTLRFINGWGSVSFTLDEGAGFGAGEIELTVGWGELTATKVVRVVGQPGFRDVGGNLLGADLVWGPDENIRVTGATNVPAGSTLRIHPGTLIQVNTTGAIQNGTLINVSGNVQAAGTRDRPIFFFSERGPQAMTLTQAGSASNPNAWRGIFLRGGGTSTFRQVFLTGAGNGTVVAHPRPPIFGIYNNHNLTVDRSVFVDNNGMVFSGQGTGTYIVRKSLISRVGIGAEYFGNGHTLRISDSWFTSIGHAPEAANRDGDLLHIDGARSDQIIRSSVIRDGGDDGLDHSHSTFRLEHSLISGIRDKGISMTGGHADVHNTLIFDSAIGIRGLAVTNYTTIATRTPVLHVDSVNTSVIWPHSIATCQEEGGEVHYSDIGNPEHLGCGEANFSEDPLYTNVAASDYNPAPGSPALTAGPTGGRIGWLGFPFGAVCEVDGDCDDGNACSADTCVNKLCKFTAIVGCNPCDIDSDCEDGNACTVDVCAPGGACTNNPADNGTACDDGQGCTSPDACNAGACAGPVNCAGGQGCDAEGECIPPAVDCVNDGDCDDGLFCNGVETCNVGSGDCEPGEAPTCDDDVGCTVDGCDDVLGACTNTASNERCDDGNLCTDDTCDALDDCQYADNVEPCDDGEPCTENDTCGGGECVGGAPPACDDGLGCTDDRCELGVGCVGDDLCPEEEHCAPVSGVCEPEPATVVIRNDDNYAGTRDTFLHAGDPDADNGEAEALVVDGDLPPEEQRQILLQFSDLIGWGPGQVPPGATIVSATVTLHITNPSDDGADLHTMLVPWLDDATWNGFDNGVQLDDLEALDLPISSAASNGNGVPVDFDVTDNVNSWAHGAGENNGWVLVTPFGGDDDWHFASSEVADFAQRPALTVVYLSCDQGFRGDGIVCEDIDECDEEIAECDEQAACNNLPGSFECVCGLGFEGDGLTCEDIDECLDVDCGPNSNCNNLFGSFECVCEPGYEEDPENPGCVDIYECDDNPCAAHATCFNSPGSFDCSCNPGFEGDGIEACEDINECDADPAPCDVNATCDNNPGGFACDCLEGFLGDGFACEDIDECAANPCDRHADCNNLPGAFECVCEAGYVGDGFECGRCPSRNGQGCSGVGECGGTPEDPLCICGPGLIGSACEACAPGHGGYPNCWECPPCDDDNPCTDNDCTEDGECVFVPNNNFCNDDDICTIADRCEDGECRGAPKCDDGDPCTVDECEEGVCLREENEGECDDDDACTENEVCVDGECGGTPVDCADDNVCTVAACDPETGCSQEWTPGCCIEDGDCALGEGCFDNECRAVHCEECADDAECGGGAHACIEYGSGSYCAVACEGVGGDCPEDSECLESAEGVWHCQPAQGDCECEAEASRACHQGNLVHFDTCAEPGEVAEDCGGRGCVAGNCCAEGTHDDNGECVPDSNGGLADAEVSPDSTLPEDAEVTPDADTEEDATTGDPDVTVGPEGDGGGIGSDDATAEAGSDAGGTTPSPDGCGCRADDGSPSSALLMLFVLLGFGRRRYTRR